MVQIYQNPIAVNAANVANQHNPEFAAYNSVMAGFHDAAISDALNKLALQDKQNDLIGGLKRAQLQRAWNKADKDDNYRRSLEDIYQMQLGGKEDVKPMNNDRLRQAIYDRGLDFSQMQQNGSTPMPNFDEMGGVVGKNKSFLGNLFSGNRTQVTDVPTVNANGRLSLENLRDIGKIYPYLSQTAQGRDYMNRLESAIRQNPDNLAALKPFLDEAASGNLQLVAPVKESFGGKYKRPTTFDEEIMNQMWDDNLGATIYSYPFLRLGAWINSHKDDYATQSEKQAAKYGYVPPKVEDLSNDFMGGFKTWLQNRERTNKAEQFIKDHGKDYVENVAQTSMTPTKQPLTDQVSTQRKLQIANYISTTYDENVDASNIQTAIDANGDMLYYANGHYFKMGRDGKAYEL